MKRRLGTIPPMLAIFLLVAAVLSTPSWAKPTTPQQARSVVLNWLGKDATPLGARLGRQIKEIQTFNYGDAPAYYVVYLNPAGMVFLPADDLVEPIIAFASQGSYDPSQTNPLGALVSNDIPGRVQQAKGVEAQALGRGETLAPHTPQAKAQRKWEWLTGAHSSTAVSESSITPISDVRVAPFVQSRWSQSTAGGTACYNYYTPPGPEGASNNYPCGCVATAMSQLMRYWQFPTTGVGTNLYQVLVDGAIQYLNLRGGNGSGGAYNWGDMVLVPASGATTTQRQAIGNLTHDVGLSVNTSYRPHGSGAKAVNAADAFVNTFQYSNAMKGYDPQNFSNIPDTNRNDMVNPNLHARYPVLFGIVGTGGHAVVCDGYGYNTGLMYHHLNLGGGGTDDAWYNLPTIDTSIGTYTSVYECIYNVYTSGSGEIIAGRVTDGRGNPLAGVAVTATAGGISYPAMQQDEVIPTTSSGIYAIPKVPSDTTFTVNATKTGYTFASQQVSTGNSINNTFTTGNRWDINFTGKRGLAGVLELLLMN